MFVQRIRARISSNSNADTNTIVEFCTSSFPSRPTAISIGNFDGVHIGHQTILTKMVDFARLEKLETVVITFHPHPKTVFAQQKHLAHEQVPIISNFYDKYQILKNIGIDRLVILEFDATLSAVSASDFLQELLLKTLRLKHLYIGEDFHFGKGRAGNFAYLTKQAQALDFQVHATESVTIGNPAQKVSSSLVRDSLKKHQLDLLPKLLGRPLQLTARVTHGAKLGRTLGFPTLNLRPPTPYALPNGIYFVKVHGIDVQAHVGVASLGVRPTVGKNLHLLLEVYLLQYSGWLYGQRVTIEFLAFSRPEQSFENLEALQTAIAQDVRAARQYFDLPL